MKKSVLIILLLALALGAFSNLGAQILVTLGDGTTTNSTSGVPTPYGTFYKNFRQQYLILASELEDLGGGPGDITSLAFNVDNVNDCSPMPNFTIKLKQTMQNELTTTFEVGDYTEVFFQNDFLPVTGWNTHTFTAPFDWDGGSNIIVEIVTTIIPGAYTQNASVFFTPTTFNSALRYQSDSVDAGSSTTGTLSVNRANVQLNMEELVLTDPPNPALAVFPQDGATLVTPFSSLSWSSGGGVPTGYTLNFGTDNPPSNIEDDLDMEEATSYTPDPALDYDTTYYWQVVPYNNIGDAADCPIWSFTTHGDAAVDELPYSQNWDAVTPPEMPFDWSAIVQSTNTAALVETSTTSPNSAPNNVRLYNSSDTAAELLLVSPQISDDIEMNTIRVKAWLRSTSTSNTMQVGVMTNPTDPSTFELVQTESFATTSYSEHSIPLSTYSGTGRFIAFRHGVDGSSRNLYVDDIMLEEIAPNDLAALAIHGNTTPSMGTATNYTIDVFNNGTVTQDTYTVKLMTADGVELASVAGTSISAGETLEIVLPWTPAAEGPMSIYGKVILTGDVNSLNDETPQIDISVQPEGVFSVTIGEGDQMQGIPWEFFYKNSLFQTLYYQAEMGMFGNITALSFYNDFTTDLPGMPVKLWLGTTTEEDLTAGWIDPTTLTLVYDGNVDFPSGANTITVPLQTPFTYAGGNLVLYAKRVMDTQYYSSSDDFLAQTIGTNRARKLQSDSTDYDPMAPSAAGTLSGTFPKATFIMSPLSDDPMFVVNPSENDFGTVLLGSTAQQNFFIANAGGGELGINSITISGDAAFSLTDLPDLPQSLETGQTLIFGVDYSPTTEGDHTAQISITDNQTREVHVIDLSGNGFDATVYTMPLIEAWDEASVPDFPLGWSTIFNTTGTSAYLRTSTTSPFSAPNCVQMANSTDAAAELILISPMFDADIDLSEVRVKFMAKGATGHLLQVGTMSDISDGTTFSMAQELDIVSNWNEYVVNLTGHTPAGQYIAFKHGNGSTYDTTYLDDVTMELIAADDLAATGIVGNTTPSMNTATNYTVHVFNNGTATQSDYQVQIVDDEGVVMATAAGDPVAPDETVSTSLSVTFSTEGAASIQGKVVLAGDINPANDLTDPLNLFVQPEDIVAVTIGEGDEMQGIPWEFYYKNSLFQTLYYPDEFGLFGLINAVSFYNDFSTDLPGMPVKLWLGTTTEEDLTDGWIDPTTLTLVYDGNVDFPSGANTITIPLQTPFEYFSGNLVLYANRPMDTQYYSSSDDFLAQTVGTNRARKLVSDSTTYDPLAPSAAGTLSGVFPKTTFFMTVDGMGALTGTVTASGSPLADVQISIDDTTFETTSSASGEYSFPYILEGDYTLTAHKVGYEDQSINFSIVEDQTTTVDIVMNESASVSVSGTVVGSDNPAVGLSDGVITLSGVMEYTGLTNDLGEFTITGVLSGNTYNYAISRAGYQTATGTIVVGATNYDMETITLEELTLPPSGVTATLNDTETAVNLIWGSPGTPGNFYFFDFENDDGDWQPTADWDDPVGDWEYTDEYDIADWNPVNPGTNVIPPNNAYSGTGLWGTVITSNYTNSGGSNFLTKTFDFSGFDNTQMSFWSWENVFGNFDYCQILVNGTLVWGPSWDYSNTTWQERIIDLSAYDGMSDVEISLEMYATTVVDYAGWYVDDIYIGPADQAVVTSPPSIIPGDFRGLSELEAAELAETRAASRPPRRMANNLRQPVSHTSRIPVGYQVWRLEAGQENTPGTWISLTPATITDTTFVDPAWESFPDGLYKWAVKTVYTNDVLSNPGFSNTIRKQPDDMSALTVSGNSTPTVGAASEYTVRIKNTGTSAQEAAAYTVKLMSDTTELAAVDGPAIAVDQELDIAIPWVPTEQGPMSIYGKVFLPDDSDHENDSSDPININVMPAGQFAYTVGEGNELANVPVNMYYKASLFQMIIYPAELGNFFGFINGLQFYNNFATDLPNMATEIYIGTTTLEDLEDGWVPITEDNATLVFDGTVNYPSGENDIVIPFAEPYIYLNGENLLITVRRPLDAQYYSSSDKFKAQTIGTNRARRAQSDSEDYDPANPPTTGTLSGQFPMTTILGIPGGVGHLSGNVTNSDDDPLEGVLVELQGAGYQDVTDVNGDYEIPYILPDTYDVVFSRYGYITQTQELELEEDEEAVINVVMQSMPEVAVSGTITASDTGSGLAGAIIQLTGYADYTESTDGNGDFLFDAVYANESYEYIISCPGYTSTTGVIDVGATAHEMGTIILEEIAYAPHSVLAELNTTYTAVELEWEAPDPNAIEILESFEDATFPPNDWSQVITNSGPANTVGVYPTFTRLGSIEIAGGNNATPTHGNYQTGLWWSYEHQDEWLITPSFNCPPDAYLRFDSYVFLGSDNGDHYYVKASTDGGNSWQILWDASDEVGGQTTYDAPFVVDLAPYGGQQITLAFQAEDPPSNDGLWFTWFIDNIYIGNAITMVSFDGPALMNQRQANGTYQAAADTYRRDGIISRDHSALPNVKSTDRNSRVLVGYDIYRFVSGQEGNEANWTQLNDETVSTLNFEDDGWEALPNGTYRWGVKAIYTAGVSSPAALSNPLAKDDVTGNIVGFVRRGNGQGIAGATVTAGSMETTTNSAGAYSMVLSVGSYTVTASAAGYATATFENVVISPNQNTTLNIVLEPSSGEDELSPVTATALKGNSPNPFNPETTIYYDILEPCKVRMDVYNLKGQKVRTLLDENKGSGRHSIVFEARDDRGNALSSGVYFYRFTAGKYVSTRKMLLME